MPAIMSTPPQRDRKRRVHAKSRKGCGNCKLRRVKCDELRPHCKKCLLYGVECNYDGVEANLQLSAQGSFQVDFGTEQVIDFNTDASRDRNARSSSYKTLPDDQMRGRALMSGHKTDTHNWSNSTFAGTLFWPASITTPFSPISDNAIMTSMIDDSLQFSFVEPDMQPQYGAAGSVPVTSWHFSSAHLEILTRFRERTALTIGGKTADSVYRHMLCHLAMTHAFLMHMLISLTLMHDADIIGSSNPAAAKRTKKTSLEHWAIATKLFKNTLSKPIKPHQRDAIWATGFVVGAASMWCVNSDKVEEVWPLKPRDSVDLGWLKLCDGKRALWEIADPIRPDSIFHDALKDQNAYTVALPDWVREPDAIARIPPHIKRIFGVTATSTTDDNVYLLTLMILSRLQNQRLTRATAHSFLQVILFVTPELVRLLESKDPRAVFIIGWWFKMMDDGDLWWMVSRAKIEGHAIRIWLEKEESMFGLAQVLDDLVPERSVPQEQP